MTMDMRLNFLVKILRMVNVKIKFIKVVDLLIDDMVE